MPLSSSLLLGHRGHHSSGDSGAKTSADGPFTCDDAGPHAANNTEEFQRVVVDRQSEQWGKLGFLSEDQTAAALQELKRSSVDHMDDEEVPCVAEQAEEAPSAPDSSGTAMQQQRGGRHAPLKDAACCSLSLRRRFLLLPSLACLNYSCGPAWRRAQALRYLRARRFDVHKALQLARESREWRRECRAGELDIPLEQAKALLRSAATTHAYSYTHGCFHS